MLVVARGCGCGCLTREGVWGGGREELGTCWTRGHFHLSVWFRARSSSSYSSSSDPRERKKKVRAGVSWEKPWPATQRVKQTSSCFIGNNNNNCTHTYTYTLTTYELLTDLLARPRSRPQGGEQERIKKREQTSPACDPRGRSSGGKGQLLFLFIINHGKRRCYALRPPAWNH